MALFLGCNRQDEPIPIPGEPVFYLRGTLDGEAFDLSAGVEGVMVNSSEGEDINGEQWYRGGLDDLSSEPMSLSLSFRDIRGISEDPIDPVSSLSRSAFNLNGLDSNAYFLVKFFADPYSASGSLIAAEWNFGDGTSSTDLQPSHAYPIIQDSYNACATLFYAGGCQRELCYMITPSLDGTVDIQFNTGIQGLVLATAITQSMIPVDFKWEFEGGGTESGPEIAFVPTPGKMVEQVCLTVVDAQSREYQICRDLVLDSVGGCTGNFDIEMENVLEISHGAQGERAAKVELKLDGEKWSALEGTGQIEILSSIDYEMNDLGLPTRKLEIKGRLSLVNDAGETRELVINEGSIAVAYPRDL